VPVDWIPPAAERELGLGFYATRAEGTGGTLKVDPEDFRVTEISQYPIPAPDGGFTVLRVLARNWEQHTLARALGERLGLPPGGIAWAGTKDRRAISEQLFSYQGPPRSIGEEPFPGVRIAEMYAARSGLVLGHHFGNAFEIRVHASRTTGAELSEHLGAIRDEVTAIGGFPNFFGPQRFGEVRPVTHLVGERLLRGDSDGAVDVYLSWTAPGELPDGEAARRAYAEHRDPRRALREFPPAYQFERTLLDHLARGQSADRALRALPRELRRLFIHAAQSLLYNRYLIARREHGLGSTEPVSGDRLLRLARDGTIPGTDPIPVTDDNLFEAQALVTRGRARIAAPLIGYKTELGGGVPGELLRSELAASELRAESFELPRQPDLASEGTWRPIAVPMPPVSFSVAPDGGAGYTIRFALPKGSYATVLLREFTKLGATRSTEGSEPVVLGVVAGAEPTPGSR
jgi:tRNA pseudouridine13 synthase